jgi:hypothetical protein
MAVNSTDTRMQPQPCHPLSCELAGDSVCPHAARGKQGQVREPGVWLQQEVLKAR